MFHMTIYNPETLAHFSEALKDTGNESQFDTTFVAEVERIFTNMYKEIEEGFDLIDCTNRAAVLFIAFIINSTYKNILFNGAKWVENHFTHTASVGDVIDCINAMPSIKGTEEFAKQVAVIVYFNVKLNKLLMSFTSDDGSMIRVDADDATLCFNDINDKWRVDIRLSMMVNAFRIHRSTYNDNMYETVNPIAIESLFTKLVKNIIWD